MTDNIRLPVVSGQFYDSNPRALNKTIESFIDKTIIKETGLGAILPHAGYIYSGRVAVLTACALEIKDNLILLGPNHTGFGSAYSIVTQGSWQTPLGMVGINSNLAQKILESNDLLKMDPSAHRYEHSLEVLLPILQYFKKQFEIVPITFALNNLSDLKSIGKQIAKVIKSLKLENEISIIASSDMTHYESEKDARDKDKRAIEAILELDEEKLAKRVKEFNISMCGFAPVAVLIYLAKELGATTAKLIKYQTSAEITGDNSSVVGYAGVIIK